MKESGWATSCFVFIVFIVLEWEGYASASQDQSEVDVGPWAERRWPSLSCQPPGGGDCWVFAVDQYVVKGLWCFIAAGAVRSLGMLGDTHPEVSNSERAM